MQDIRAFVRTYGAVYMNALQLVSVTLRSVGPFFAFSLYTISRPTTVLIGHTNYAINMWRQFKNTLHFDENKMLSYHRKTALQGALVLAKSKRLELEDNILQTL